MRLQTIHEMTATYTKEHGPVPQSPSCFFGARSSIVIVLTYRPGRDDGFGGPAARLRVRQFSLNSTLHRPRVKSDRPRVPAEI